MIHYHGTPITPLGNVGTVCVPNGPCLIPVAPGLMAPSGVLLIGAADEIERLRAALREIRGIAHLMLPEKDNG